MAERAKKAAAGQGGRRQAKPAKRAKQAKPGATDLDKTADDHLKCLGPDWDAELRGPQNARMRLFVLEYLKDRNGTQAAIRAGYGAKGARVTAVRLLTNANVAAVIEAHEKALAKSVGMEVEEYARLTLEVAQADAQAVSQARRLCCRYCHSGDPLLPQLKPSEYASRKAAYDQNRLVAEVAGKTFPEFAFKPGNWYDTRKPPNPECAECRGDGVLDVFIADSRALSGVHRRLFRGVKQGKDGIEVKLADQDAAWVNYGRIIGAFNDQQAASNDKEVVPEMLDRLFGDVQELMAQRREAVRARRKERGG